MSPVLADLGISLPVLAAPMAGGPSTPEFVGAAASVGSLGQLAAGYKTPQALAEQIETVRDASIPFGVNVFVPNPLPVDDAAFRRYADAIRVEADRYGLQLDDRPIEDDDAWHDKIDLLLASSVPLVSFTFGLPAPHIIAAFRRAGTVVVQTITSVDEAVTAAAAGVDVLAVQAAAAGGHSGTWTPTLLPTETSLSELIVGVGNAVSLPLLGAGGVATPEDVAAALRAGADAVVVGTVLLRAPESGASATHQNALATATETVVTRAFTGRPARAVRNDFINRYDRLAPSGYPAVHHLTSALRKAAAGVGDADRVHLWAGTGVRHTTTDPVGATLARLAGLA